MAPLGARSLLFWQFARANLIRDYKDARTAPPPLNLLFGVRGTLSLALLIGGTVCGATAAQYAVCHYCYAAAEALFGTQLAVWAAKCLKLGGKINYIAVFT